MVEGESMSEQKVKKKRGRPRKTDIQSKTKGSRGSVGRPKGDAAVINEYKARMLSSPRSKKVLDSIFNAALDDDHRHQAAAWKIITDRIVPASYFEKDKMSGGRGSIDININIPTDRDTVTADVSSGAIDAEYEEVDA